MGHWVSRDGSLGYQINKHTWVSWYQLTPEVLKAMVEEKVITNLDFLAAMMDAKR